MKKSSIILMYVIMVGLCLQPLFAQSRESGAIEGTVTASGSGEALPGVVLRLTSPNMIGGAASAVAGEHGKYRFAALLPGIYKLETAMDGFVPQQQADIRVTVGKTLTQDFHLTLESLQEEIKVLARPPLIDVKDSQAAAVEMEPEYVHEIPSNRYFFDVINMAPGAVNRVIFGGGSEEANTFNIDGVNTSDPYFAGAFCLLDWNTIESAKVLGIGAPAEYDGFTGASVDIITKTGGNTFQGGLEFYYQGRSWNSDNTAGIDWETIPDKPAIQNIEPSFFLGGPIIKDKLWFYTNLSYKMETEEIADFPEDSFATYPHFFLKLTALLSKKDRLQVSTSLEKYREEYDYAVPGWPLETSGNYQSDHKLFNVSWLHTFNDNTYMQVKVAGYHANEFVEPNGGSAYPHFDFDTNQLSGNLDWNYDTDRFRIQGDISVTHHAEDFIAGSHDFKFGVEVEHAAISEDYGFVNDRMYYHYSYGGNDYSYFIEWEGYLLDCDYQRYSLYAQDNWTVGRFTINPGIRYNIYRGSLNGETLYKPTGLAPRFGITFDVFGDHTTALKAHYGRYFSQMRALYMYPASPTPDLDFYYLNPGTGQYEYGWSLPVGAAQIDDKLKHPAADQYALAIERELGKDLVVELSYIYKKHLNILGKVETHGQWQPVTYYDANTGQTYNLWSLTTDPGDAQYLVTNPKSGIYDGVPITPTSAYHGLQFELNKRFSNRWQMMLSYTYSRHTGNIDISDTSFSGEASTTGSFFTSKNNFVNTDGLIGADRSHIFKLYGSVLMPFDISFAVNFEYYSGRTYNRLIHVFADNIVDYGRTTIRAEARGDLRYPAVTRLDLRLEKQFHLGNDTVSILLDAFNVLNANTVTSRENAFGETFGKAYTIMPPRRFQLGIRYHFNF